MKTSYLAFSALAIVNGVYGMPTTEVSTGLSLAKRDLPYPEADYEICLDKTFKEGFNGVTQWADVVCPGNSRISFFGQQTTGWESGIACYEAGKEDLRKKIKEGHRRATVQVCAHNGDPKWCCQIGVRSLIYPVHNYVDCLNNEVRQSMHDNNQWGTVTCPNNNIKFNIKGFAWINPKDCYNALQKNLENKLYHNDAYAYEQTSAGWVARCAMWAETTD